MFGDESFTYLLYAFSYICNEFMLFLRHCIKFQPLYLEDVLLAGQFVGPVQLRPP